jgi:hypothetical protein
VAAADWLPDPAVYTRHEAVVELGPERALAHALSVPVAPDRLTRLLLRARGLDPSGSIGRFATSPPFVVLRRARTELVVGLGAAVWTPGRRQRALIAEPGQWPGWSEPGTVRVVVTFIARGDEGRGWSRLITETAAQPTDDAARRAFRRYWLVAGPFSRLIRRSWLRAIRRRAATLS